MVQDLFVCLYDARGEITRKQMTDLPRYKL